MLSREYQTILPFCTFHRHLKGVKWNRRRLSRTIWILPEEETNLHALVSAFGIHYCSPLTSDLIYRMKWQTDVCIPNTIPNNIKDFLSWVLEAFVPFWPKNTADFLKSSFSINSRSLKYLPLFLPTVGFRCLYCLLEFETIGCGGETKHQAFLISKNSM